MIYDFLIEYWLLVFLLMEVGILLCLYRFVLRQWIFDHYYTQFTGNDSKLLREILLPITDTIYDDISDNIPDLIITKVKQELLASQGTVTRVANASPSNDAEAGLGVAEEILKGLGWRSPNALLVAKLAGVLGNMLGQNVEETEPETQASDPSGMPDYF